MTSKTPSELDEIIKAHSDKDMFASKVIVEAAKQMKAAKLRSGASYDAKDADGKVDKAEVNYSQGKGNDCCRNCVHFQPGVDQDATGACELVEGPIDPDGWCKLFEAKG